MNMAKKCAHSYNTLLAKADYKWVLKKTRQYELQTDVLYVCDALTKHIPWSG